MKKILFICPYPTGQAPSQRFRFEQYIQHLEENGFGITVRPFFTQSAYATFQQSGRLLSKIRAITESFLRRITLLFEAQSYDLIFVHREAAPVGPPVIEWWLAKIAKKKVVYDFDDAIWLTDKQNESPIAALFRWRQKVSSICRWSHRVCCGNQYLADYARRFNSQVVIIPTTIDTGAAGMQHTPSRDNNGKITIGWTGSRTTLKYLEAIVEVLQSIEKTCDDVETVVIADRNPELPLKRFRFIPWSPTTEIADVAQLHIGVMPLPDDEWAKGKCGFKALQYMALAIPALVSPVGVNTEIVTHGREGYWCRNDAEWEENLRRLIADPHLREEMGSAGRQVVIDRYSTSANSSRFLSLFQ